MERIRKFFRKVKKQLIVGFSHDYIHTNGTDGETRRLPEECPYCHAKNPSDCRGGPVRWYGSCKLFWLFDTTVMCERNKCDACQGVWGYKYYYPDEAPYGATSS